mgnify:CR=1 FL=1
MKKAIRNLLHRLKRFFGIISLLAAVTMPIEASAQQPIPVKGNIGITGSGGIGVNVSGEGHLETEVHGPVSAFGEVSIAANEPVIQEQFVYGASTEAWAFFINGGASTSSASNMLVLNSGAETFSHAAARSRHSLTYKAGQGALVRFTAMFSTGAVATSQLAGLGNSESFVGFGTGVTDGNFGVFRSSGGLRDVNRLSVDTKSSNSQTVTITLNGQAFSCTVTNGATINTTANEIGDCDYTTMYPGWITEVEGSTVVFIPLTPGPMTGTFSASFPTSGVGTFSEVTAGVNPNIEQINQASWNIDVMDGTASTSNPSGMLLDKSKLQVYAIKYQYLGAGALEFMAEDASSGELVPVHRIRYAGREYSPSLSNPTMPITFSVRNVGVAGNKTLSVASAGAFVQGEIKDLGQQRSYQVSKTGFGTSFIPILTLRNSRIRGSRINQSELVPIGISISNTGGKAMEFEVREQSDLGNSAYFSYVSTNTSAAKVDFSATTALRGIARLTRGVSSGASADIDLQRYGFTIEAGNQIVILIKANSATTDATVSLQWVERQ